MEPTPLPLPTAMRQARQEARISVDLLRRRLGLSLPTLAARERGERRLYPDEARRYLRALANLDRERLLEVQKRSQRTLSLPTSGSDLREIRRRAMLSYTTLAPHLGYPNPEHLRADEISPEPWEPKAVRNYLETLLLLLNRRSTRLRETVETLLGQIEERVVPPLKRRPLDPRGSRPVESRPMPTATLP